MARHYKLLVAAVTAFCVLLAIPVKTRAQANETAVVINSASVLDEICRKPDGGVPHSMLAGATAVAIIPDVIKIGFVGAVRRGKGTVLVRQADGSWSNPIFVTLTGGGIGFQAGAQATDVILVFKSRESVEGMLGGKFTLGADAAIAAGPVGRQAAAATDAQLRAEILSYSRSRGLFAGVSLDGAALKVDHPANSLYYGVAGLTPADVFTNRSLPVPAPTATLTTTLAQYSAPPAAELAPHGVPVPVQDPLLASGQVLARSARQFYAQVDPRWQTYFALPQSVFSETAKPAVLELEHSLAKFNAIELDPKYDAITKLQSCQATKQALVQYIRVAKTQSRPQPSAPPQPPAGQFR